MKKINFCTQVYFAWFEFKKYNIVHIELFCTIQCMSELVWSTTSNDLLSHFVLCDMNHYSIFKYCVCCIIQAAGSRRNTNVMLVWISCVSGPRLLHKMILLVFNSVCAPRGGSSNLFQCEFSDLFSGPSCSQYSNPAAQSLIQPFVHIFCGPQSTKDVHQNMSWESGCFFNTRESVSFFIAFNYLQIGTRARDCRVRRADGAPVTSRRAVNVCRGHKCPHLCSQSRRGTVIHSLTCIMYKLDLAQKNKYTFVHVSTH